LGNFERSFFMGNFYGKGLEFELARKGQEGAQSHYY
jgi:hypothetical protein